jgi:septum site-determining protein MinC
MTAARQSARGSAAAAAIQFRGGLFTLMQLRVVDPRDQAFFTGVMEKIAQAPDFFRHAPVVLDLQDLAEAPPFNMAELVRRLRQHQLVPVAVANGTDEQNKSAVNAGLALMPAGRDVQAVREAPAPRPVAPAESEAEAARNAVPAPVRASASPPARGETLLVTQPIRSGQQVCARDGDMVVVSPISSGAELRARGHIHVYGPLRGRAFAGEGGDLDARIFCQSLEAELVAVAGVWRVRDDMPEALIGKPVQIFIDGETLSIAPLS